MQNWKLFEQEACDYLRSSFKDYPFTFECRGGSDSTLSDICVLKKGVPLFYIEAKLCPAQSGQFTLSDNISRDGNTTFEYSRENEFPINNYSKQIIQYINRNSSAYSTVKQSGLDLPCSREILFGWVTQHYKSKNSKFIITSKSLKGFKAIVPIDDFGKWFTVTACVRRKKSGTSDVPQYQFDLAKQVSRRVFEEELGFKIHNFEVIEGKRGKRLVLNPSSNVSLKRNQRYLPDSMYLSKDSSDKNRFIISKRSPTNNITVVFSVNYMDSSSRGLDELEKELKKYL